MLTVNYTFDFKEKKERKVLPRKRNINYKGKEKKEKFDFCYRRVIGVVVVVLLVVVKNGKVRVV